MPGTTSNDKASNIEQIINVFNTIDNRVQSLHECSGEDFLTLNKHLKDFHKETKDLKEHLKKIKIILDSPKSLALFDQIDKLPESIKEQIKKIEKHNKHNIILLDKIYKNLNLLWVPLKNFRQNLLTLKFLITNLKLNFSCFSNMNNKTLDNELANLDEFIQEIKNIYPEIDKNLWNLKINVKNRLFKLNEQREKNLNALDSVISLLRSGISLFFVKHEKSNLQATKVETETNNGLKGINHIITNLQYHDIIRQKMEHIQSAHKEIIKELISLEKENNKNALKEYLSQIPDIAELQVAQLIYTNKEYQQAIENITKQFYDIAEKLSSISTMSYHYHKHSSKDDRKVVKDIFSRFEKALTLLEDFSTDNYEISMNINSLEKVTGEMQESISKVFNIDMRLETLASNLLNKNKDESDCEKTLSNTAKQIHLLCSEMHSNMHTLKKVFNQALVLSEKLTVKSDEKKFQDEFVENNKEIHKEITQIKNSVNENLDQVYEILSNNSKQSADISESLRNSIDGVNYYDFFDKVIDDIISGLNEVFKIIKKEDIDIKKIERSDNVTNLKKHYTTMSEHLIHSKFLNNESPEQEAETKDEEDLGDVELF